MIYKQANAPSKALWPVFFITLIVKYAYYAYSYYPIVDDNNMYGTFRLYHNIFNDVILKYRMYTTRPVAAFLDPYLWAKFWSNLGITLLIITVLHFLICFFVYKIFSKNGLNIGIPVIVIFALLPFGSEATYWLAASSRIVVGMFLMALALFLLSTYFEGKYKGKTQKAIFILFVITHLLSLGFYEQIIAMSLLLTLLLFAVNWQSLKHKWTAVFPFINFGLIAFWYKFFSSHGNMAARGQLVSGHYIAHTKSVLKAIYDIWRICTKDLIETSFIEGLKTLISNKSFIFLGLILALSVAVFLLSLKENYKDSPSINIFKLILGGFLFMIPLLPFFAISLIWICNRNIFLSFVGLGLMVEAIMNLLSRNRMLHIARSMVISLLVLVFLVANVYELTYYRNIGKIDQDITARIAQLPEAKAGKSLYVFNTKINYVGSSGGRIGNATGADWALTGALNAQQNGVVKFKYAYPVPPEINTPGRIDLIKASNLLGIDDSRNVFPLTISREEGNTFYLSDGKGNEFGRVDLLDNEYIKFHLTREGK